MIARDNRRIIWDAANRLEWIERDDGLWERYRYDPLGRVVLRDIVRRGSTTTIKKRTRIYWDYLEASPRAGLRKLYFAGSLMIATRERGRTYWYHQDHLGSVRLITNQAGHAHARVDYRAFGERATKAILDPFGSAFGFGGQRLAGNGKLSQMGARLYDPRLARFISPDTIVPDETNPDALNRYSFVYNDPQSYVDPSGHEPVSAQPSGPVMVDAGSLSKPDEPIRWHYGPCNTSCALETATDQADAPISGRAAGGSAPETAIGSQFPGTQAGAEATAAWAEMVVEGQRRGDFEGAAMQVFGWIGGLPAALWTPETAVQTTFTLGVKPEDAIRRWNEFLGEGPHSNIHPRTGFPDPNRIVSVDGTRSIRFGPHEMNSPPTRFHYHEETWTFDASKNTWFVDNVVVRVPMPKGSW